MFWILQVIIHIPPYIHAAYTTSAGHLCDLFIGFNKLLILKMMHKNVAILDGGIWNDKLNPAPICTGIAFISHVMWTMPNTMTRSEIPGYIAKSGPMAYWINNSNNSGYCTRSSVCTLIVRKHTDWHMGTSLVGVILCDFIITTFTTMSFNT